MGKKAEEVEKAPTASNGDAIIGDVVGAMPEPQEHAIEAEAADEQVEQEKVEKHSHLRDKHGRSFDPAIHRVDDSGSPRLGKNGLLSIKPGRGTKSEGTGAKTSGSTLNPPGQDKNQGPDKGSPREAGHMIAENMFMLGQLLGGEEWAPLEVYNPQFAQEHGIHERNQMREAWATYCEAKDIGDIPPGVMVTMVVAQYAALRLSMPKTKTRMQKAKGWIAQKVANYKARKYARSNSGNDAKREKQSGETPSA